MYNHNKAMHAITTKYTDKQLRVIRDRAEAKAKKLSRQLAELNQISTDAINAITWRNTYGAQSYLARKGVR